MSEPETSPPSPAVTEKRIAGRLIHPAALLFPEYGDAERVELRASIAERGMMEGFEIVLDVEGRVLDGRHRLQACAMTGKEPRFITYRGDDPIAFVMAANMHRRHLTEGQRQMLGAQLLPMYEAEARERKIRAAHAREEAKAGSSRVGQLAHSGPEDAGRARDQAAMAAGVSSRSVERAAIVLEHGAPELGDAVRAGVVAVSTAADLAELPLSEQVEVMARGEKEILARAKEIRAARQANNRAERVERITRIAQGNRPLEAGPERYAIIMADPPWQYDAPISETREIENHYPTMPTAEICALDVAPKLATPDALLLLWATAPMLLDALAVVAAWGFEYKEHQIWSKTGRTGAGRWLRVEHEILIWAVRGKIPVPPPALRPPSVIEWPTGEHSRKPAIFAEHIERAYAGLPMIELFCRKRHARPGWAWWGNEADDDEGEAEAAATPEGGAEADRAGAGGAPAEAAPPVARARRSPRRARPDVAPAPGPEAA